MQKRVRWIAVGAAVVLVAGGAAYGARKWQFERAQAAQCERVQAVGSREPTPSPTPDVAVLGDSYAQGMELDDPARAWPYLAFESVTVNAIGGTGFINPGPCGEQTFQDRLDDVLDAGAPALVVQGGLNDGSASRQEEQQAAEQLLAGIPAGVTVLLVGPVDAPARDEATVTSALSSAADAADVAFLDMTQFEFDFLPDGVHLTAAAHVQFAGIVADTLAPSL